MRSGALELRALLWRPAGPEPLPAVVFNHGSGHVPATPSARRDRRHPELLGPVFARHGYAFLYLFRRGDGLSAGQGVPTGERMDRELVAGGEQARDRLQLELLEGDEMEDVLAGLAFLRAVPGVDPRRVAIAGHSFGGSLALLAAERDADVRAVVAFAAAEESWARSPLLRARLLAAAGRIAAPLLLLYAANDYSVAPGQALGGERARVGKPCLLKIYPRAGRDADKGHDFVHLGVPTWESDVFAFLDAHVKPARPGGEGLQ